MSGQSFGRRTWDESEYAEKARDRKRQEREKWRRQKAGGADSVSAHEFYSDRRKQIRQVDEFKRVNVVSSGTGKEAGFYCEVCHRKFKDNLKLIEHLNSKEHLANAGFDADKLAARQVTVEEVKQRLEYLKKKLAKKAFEQENPVEAQERAREILRERRRKRRKVRKERRGQSGEGAEDSSDDSGIVEEPQDDLVAVLGFGSFGHN